MFVAKDVGDLSQVHDFTRRAAGAELNVAIGLARLGFRVGVRKFGCGPMLIALRGASDLCRTGQTSTQIAQPVQSSTATCSV
jgi:sugar/nucleoside kinase (ribokinase family)